MGSLVGRRDEITRDVTGCLLYGEQAIEAPPKTGWGGLLKAPPPYGERDLLMPEDRTTNDEHMTDQLVHALHGSDEIIGNRPGAPARNHDGLREEMAVAPGMAEMIRRHPGLERALEISRRVRPDMPGAWKSRGAVKDDGRVSEDSSSIDSPERTAAGENGVEVHVTRSHDT